MNTKPNKWFLITTGESSDVAITAYSNYADAKSEMHKQYNLYKFDTSDESDGTCWIGGKNAYVDSPYDGWQRHWMIIDINTLADMDIEKEGLI